MGRVELIDGGSGAFELTVRLPLAEMERVDRLALERAGARLKDFARLGTEVQFSLLIDVEAESALLLDLLLFFGEDGWFDCGEDLDRHRYAPLPTWQKAALRALDTSLAMREDRVMTLRRLERACAGRFPEAQAREYLHARLREKYRSAIFVETMLWRWGWPDTRPAAAPTAEETADLPLSASA